MNLFEGFLELILFLHIEINLFLPDGLVRFVRVGVEVGWLVGWHECLALKAGDDIGSIFVTPDDVLEDFVGRFRVEVCAHPGAAGVVDVSFELLNAPVELLAGWVESASLVSFDIFLVFFDLDFLVGWVGRAGLVGVLPLLGGTGCVWTFRHA